MMLHLTKIPLVLLILVPKITSDIVDIVPRCPPHLLQPCKCLFSPDKQRTVIKCVYRPKDRNQCFRDYRDVSAIKSLNEHTICALYIENACFVDFDREVGNFIKTPIIVMRNVGINYFDIFVAFRRTEDIFYALILRNVTVLELLIDEDLVGFKQFRIFHLEECSQTPTSSPLNAAAVISRLPNSVCEISINKCFVESLQDNAFAKYRGISKLSLRHNLLNSIKRNYLPRPANKFSSYDISFNPINSLPDDVFADMPELKEVRLKGTNLKNLDYNIFKPILGQLSLLEIADIPLTCDCESSWLSANIRIREDSSGIKCNLPISLRNRDLFSLDPLDLCISCEEVLRKNNTI